MSERLRDQIALLRDLTPKLNAVTDEAARIVQAVEHFLTEECKLGLPVFVIIDREERNNGFDFERHLEYARIDGKFRLLVSDVEVHPDGNRTVFSRTPWVNCPRDLKLASFEFIPQLFEEIPKRVKRRIEVSERAAKSVKQLLQDLGVLAEMEDRP